MIFVKKTSINQWYGPLFNQNPYIYYLMIQGIDIFQVFCFIAEIPTTLKGL